MNHEELDAEFERIVSGWDIDADEPTPRAAVPRPDPGIDPAPSAQPSASAQPSPSAPASPSAPPSSNAQSSSQPASPPTAPPEDGKINPPPVLGGTGLTIPVAPTTSHVWRSSAAADAPPSPGDESVLDDASVLDDDHFVPEEPELPSAEDDPMFWAIVIGLAGGPLLLLYVLLFDRGGSPWWIVTGLLMAVVGFIMLVLRGSDDRDPFDDGSRV